MLRGVRNCFLHRDGTTRWIETDAEPAFEGGCFVGVRGVSHDVTLRVQLEAQVAESRQYLESVLLGSREAIITLDLDGKIKLWNRGAFEVFGYDAAEATGKTLASLVGLASGTGSVTDLIRTVIDNDGWLTSEASVVKDKRGDMKLVTTSYSVIKDARGNVKGLSVICRDIGERLRYEKAILRAAAEWRDTFDAVPDLIMIIDGDYNILRLNRAVADASGHHPAEIVGKKCYRVIHGSDHPLPDCPHRLFMETGVKTTAVIHDPRRARYYEVTCSRIPGLLGDKTSVHVMRDVTERIASEEELKRSRETYRTLVEMVPGGGIYMRRPRQNNVRVGQRHRDHRTPNAGGSPRQIPLGFRAARTARPRPGRIRRTY